MDRRDFLATGAGAAAVLTVTATATPAQGAAWLSGVAPAESLSRARFEAWLNTQFRVRAVGALRTSRVMLSAVDGGPCAAGVEQFHVMFRGDRPTAPGLYELTPENGEAFCLYLEPVGCEGATALVRATFSLVTGVQGAA